jgi:hypothetical protein
MWRYELGKRVERVQMFVAWHVPRWLAYWCTIRVMAHATTGEYGMTDPTREPMMTVLQRWDR